MITLLTVVNSIVLQTAVKEHLVFADSYREATRVLSWIIIKFGIVIKHL